MPSPRIAELLAGSTADDLWEEILASGTPLIEPCDPGHRLVTFLWRGEARSTRAYWGVDVPMTRLPGTDIWAGTEVLPVGLRTTYCIVHDDVRDGPADASGTGGSHIDTLNPARFTFPADPADPDDYDTWLSVLSLPFAPDEPWLSPAPGVKPGVITETTAFGENRPVAVYTPDGVPAAGLPVLVCFDGYNSREVLRFPTILDNLIAAGRIPPIAALFVSNFDATRERDLSPTPALSAFVIGELLPWARTELDAGTGPRRNIVTGASLGGLAAAYLGLRHPDAFGAVIAQSGSFWWPRPDRGESGELIREVAQQPPSDVRFYLDVGVRETMAGPGGAPDQLSMNRAMRDALLTHGHHVTYAEYVGGHDYINWRRTFADGMIAVT